MLNNYSLKTKQKARIHRKINYDSLSVRELRKLITDEEQKQATVIDTKPEKKKLSFLRSIPFKTIPKAGWPESLSRYINIIPLSEQTLARLLAQMSLRYGAWQEMVNTIIFRE